MTLLTTEQAKDDGFIKSFLSKDFQIKDFCSHLKGSYNSFAYEINNEIIVRFPRKEASIAKFIKEEQVLSFLKNKTTLQIPDVSLVKGDFLYACHKKIQGKNIYQNDLDNLSPKQKVLFCNDIAQFIYELNSQTKEIAKAIDIPTTHKIQNKTKAQILYDFMMSNNNFGNADKKKLEQFLENFPLVNSQEHLKFSHLDLMAKNISFDFNKSKINGIYDFGDCGIDDVYYDFSQAGLDFNISTIKTIAKQYKTLTNIDIDDQKVKEYSFYSWLCFYHKHQTQEALDEVKKCLISK